MARDDQLPDLYGRAGKTLRVNFRLETKIA